MGDKLGEKFILPLFSAVPEFALPTAPLPFLPPPAPSRLTPNSEDVSQLLVNTRPVSQTNSLTQLGLLHEQQLIEKVGSAPAVKTCIFCNHTDPHYGSPPGSGSSREKNRNKTGSYCEDCAGRTKLGLVCASPAFPIVF